MTERISELRQGLRRRFSNKPNAVQTTGGSQRLNIRSPSPHWIVGRGLCLYRCEDFTNVPRNKRRAAVELRLPVWSPFARTGYHCVWSGGVAMVWYWDGDKVQVGEELFDAPAAADSGVRIVPETVFRPTKSSGVHLQACQEGFELQRWQGEVLEDAFWLPDRPTEQDIAWFVGRGADAEGAPDPDLPLTPATVFLAEPWSGSLAPREWLEANEIALVAACFLALGLVLVWQEVRYWKTHYASEVIVAEFESTQDTLAPELAARAEVVDLRRQNRALAGILDEPSQARLMAIAGGVIPSTEARFVTWRYQQGELSIVVEDPAPDPIAYVESFAAVPLFGEVQAAPDRRADRLQITLRVVP